MYGKYNTTPYGTVDTDKYFDSNGNPIALSKGQYGIKHSGKITLLLNKNGYTKICVDNILNGFPWEDVLLALKNIPKIGTVIEKPEALGNIRNVTYIYSIFYQFGLIDVPEDLKEKMGIRVAY